MLLKWEAHKKRLQINVIVMTQRRRGRGRPINTKNVEYVIDLRTMMRTMMARMDAVEASQRRGITHVLRDDSDDEKEEDTIREEQEE